MKTIKLKGKVKSGFGNACFWVEKINQIFREKYNMKLFLGTLNIELEMPYVVDSKEKILPTDYGGKYEVFVEKATLLEHEVYILRPEINNREGGDHNLNTIEIVADIKLRKTCKLQDGDEVELSVYRNN